MSPQGSAHPKLGLSASELLGGLSKCNCSSACGGDEELPICRPAPESKPRLDCVLCVVPSLGARHTSLENAEMAWADPRGERMVIHTHRARVTDQLEKPTGGRVLVPDG